MGGGGREGGREGEREEDERRWRWGEKVKEGGREGGRGCSVVLALIAILDLWWSGSALRALWKNTFALSCTSW